MKKKHKILLGILVLAGCLLFGCEERRTELFTEEEQDMVETGQGRLEDGDTGFAESGEAGVWPGFDENGDPDQAGSTAVQDPASEILEASGQKGQGLQNSQQITDHQTIFVYVCGAVERPGVYELAGDTRVYQAVEAAGGFLPEACEEYVNQAGILTDGKRLYIPTEDEVRSLEEAEKDPLTAELLKQPEEEIVKAGGLQDTGQMEAQPAEKTTGLVNINTASLDELCTLPGIGEGKARRIISYRESTGRFEQIEDIMKVEGIKEGLFGKIRDLITAG